MDLEDYARTVVGELPATVLHAVMRAGGQNQVTITADELGAYPAAVVTVRHDPDGRRLVIEAPTVRGPETDWESLSTGRRWVGGITAAAVIAIMCSVLVPLGIAAVRIAWHWLITLWGWGLG